VKTAGFEVLVTTGKNMVSQQNLKTRTIAIVALGNSQWRIAQRYVRKIAASVNAAIPGSYAEVDIPFRQRRAAVKRTYLKLRKQYSAVASLPLLAHIQAALTSCRSIPLRDGSRPISIAS